MHDEAEDRRKEREAEAKSGGIDGLVMIPPSVHTRTQWLVTTAWKAEYLPIMDTGPLVRQGGDFFTTVRAGFFLSGCFWLYNNSVTASAFVAARVSVRIIKIQTDEIYEYLHIVYIQVDTRSPDLWLSSQRFCFFIPPSAPLPSPPPSRRADRRMAAPS